MGKKGNKGNKGKQKQSNVSANLPHVSICTPTFNRRPFFKGLIHCISKQDYPRDKIEWIVVDDGTDCVRDIIEGSECQEKLKGIHIRYFYEKDKMDLGKKRNYMHARCQFVKDEDIIVYMDDDDYYPPERVSHSVQKLVSNKDALCGGASELYLWFNTLDKMYKFGPYGPNHATAGTFAFKRKLLKDTSYEDNAVLAEEKHFLKNYTVPFVQFDTYKTILVVSHEQNTFDKKRLVNDNNQFCHASALKVKNFIKDSEMVNFYQSEINELLKDYEAGEVKNKPKVLGEIKRRDEERKSMEDNRPSGIVVSDDKNQSKQLSIKEVKLYMQSKTNECVELKSKVNELMGKLQNGDVLQGDDRLSGIVATDESKQSKELTIKEVKQYMSMKTQECVFLKNKVQELVKENEELKKRSCVTPESDTPRIVELN